MVDFPAPFGPTKPVTWPGQDGERHPVERQRRAEPLAQAGDFDRCFHARQGREPAPGWSSRLGAVFGVTRLREFCRRGSLLRVMAGIARSGDAALLASGDNGVMSLTADRRAGWTGRVGRIAAARYGLAAGAALLGLAAVVEALARAAVSAATTLHPVGQSQAVQFLGLGLLFCMLGLATTLPLAFLRPAPAAVVFVGGKPAFAGPVPLPHRGGHGSFAGRDVAGPGRLGTWHRGDSADGLAAQYAAVG